MRPFLEAGSRRCAARSDGHVGAPLGKSGELDVTGLGIASTTGCLILARLALSTDAAPVLLRENSLGESSTGTYGTFARTQLS